MTSRNKTKTEAVIEEHLSSLDPESTRYKVLNQAKRFKSNWLDLAEILSQLLVKNEFVKWGYASFEDYCKRELKIKPDTAMKLVSSFGYLKKYKPELTKSDPVKTKVPDYKTIDQLTRVEDDLETEDAEELRKNLFEDNFTTARLKKKINELMPGEEEEKSQDEVLIEKMKTALNSITKIIQIFEPDGETEESIKKLEKFIFSIEA